MSHNKSRIFRRTLILCAILALTAVTVLAYLSASTGSLTNTFKPAKNPAPNILEGADGKTFDGITKSDVKVDVGDPGYAVYVRAVIVVNWESDTTANTFHATKPVLGTDYTMDLNTATDGPWFYNSADGFYYHKAMVTSGATNALITSCQLTENPTRPEGYHLDVQIIAQTIQALGTTDADQNIPAVQDAWDIAVSNGILVDPNSQ